MNSAIQVFIPAAGRGTRSQNGERRLPKPILSIGEAPLIYRVMSLYPENTNFLIGLGFESNWVKQVAEVAASANNQKVAFFETDSWADVNKGLSHTMIALRFGSV